jgi:hypothetical protein
MASLLSAGFLLIFGGIIVAERTSVAPIEYQPGTWSGAGGISVTPVASGYEDETGLQPLPRPNVPHKYVSPFGARPQPPSTAGQEEQGIDDILSVLTKPPKGGDTSTSSAPEIAEAYSFIPTGLFSITETTQQETEEQTALRRYGNDIGSIIQSFELEHPDQATVLKNHMEDKNNPAKIAAMKELAAGFTNIAQLMANTTPIPDMMRAPATALAKAYLDLGKYLSVVPDSRGDDELYDAILAYNGSAERFVATFVNFALLFQASGVRFAQEESGSVFMFQQAGGAI